MAKRRPFGFPMLAGSVRGSERTSIPQLGRLADPVSHGIRSCCETGIVERLVEFGGDAMCSILIADDGNCGDPAIGDHPALGVRFAEKCVQYAPGLAWQRWRVGPARLASRRSVCLRRGSSCGLLAMHRRRVAPGEDPNGTNGEYCSGADKLYSALTISLWLRINSLQLTNLRLAVLPFIPAL